MTPKKPPHGAPCNGCGQCCKNELCPLGAAIFRQVRGPCPALEDADGAYSCGLVLRPAHYMPVRAFIAGAAKLRAAALLLIGAGHGCDAQRDDEPYDHKFGRRIRETARRRPMREIEDALEAWGFHR
jgi:hypothetical protein